jgi:hypothetical protein
MVAAAVKWNVMAVARNESSRNGRSRHILSVSYVVRVFKESKAYQSKGSINIES